MLYRCISVASLAFAVTLPVGFQPPQQTLDSTPVKAAVLPVHTTKTLLEGRLGKIFIERTELKSTPPVAALRQISQHIASQNADSLPAGFILCLPSAPAKPAEPSGSQEQAPATVPGKVSVADAAEAAATLAGLQCTFIGNVAVLHPAETNLGEALEMEEFSMPVSVIGGMIHSGDFTPDALKKCFADRGVQLSGACRLFYSTVKFHLFVTAPRTELAKIRTLLTPLCMDVDQVMIETKIVRATTETLEKLGVNPSSTKTDWGKLATSPEAETLAGGSAIAMSGNEVILEVVKQQYFPTSYGNQPLSPYYYGNTPASTTTPTPSAVPNPPPAPAPLPPADGAQAAGTNTAAVTATTAPPVISTTTKTFNVTVNADSRPPVPIVGFCSTMAFGDPTNIGYTLKVTPSIRDETIINLQMEPQYAGLDDFSATDESPEKMPVIQLWRTQTQIELADGATQCIARRQTATPDGGRVWLFTLVTVKLVGRDGLPRGKASQPTPTAKGEIAETAPPPPTVVNATPALAAILSQAIACDLEPTGDLAAFLKTMFAEQKIELSLPTDGVPALPFKIGAFGTITRGDLLDRYLRLTGLRATCKENQIVVKKPAVGRWDIPVSQGTLRIIVHTLTPLETVPADLGSGRPAAAPPVPEYPTWTAFNAVIPLAPDTTFRHLPETGMLRIEGNEAANIHLIKELLTRGGGWSDVEQVEVEWTAVEITRKDLLELARKNGFSVQDALGNGGVLPLALAELVRNSKKAKLIGSLTGHAMSGNEAIAEDVVQRYLPTSWGTTDVILNADGKPSLIPPTGKVGYRLPSLPQNCESVPGLPEFGDPTNLGATMKFTPSVRDGAIINVTLEPQQTELDGYQPYEATVVIQGVKQKPTKTPMPTIALLRTQTQLELTDGATVQIARVQGRKPVADSASKAFFGGGNILNPGTRLGEERDLFMFLSASFIKLDGTPAKK